jgi:tRNA-specific 2-thiouridylase
MAKNIKNKIACAMSGGVDSSVAAALLKETGNFEVIGVFMKLWPEKKSGFPKNSYRKAKEVAQSLKIPFYTFDFEKEFREKVIGDFLKENKLGVTPNPCVVCNKAIKFKLFFDEVKKLGVDFIATGHYARTREKNGITKLIKAKDKNKDQSYFLWQLSQKQIEKVLFPVGGYKKVEVKKLAKKFKLSCHDFAKSQEACFIKTTVKDFLKQHLSKKPGKIIDAQTLKTIGIHQGLWFYTIGQRKGIMLSGGPFYVLAKDIKKNVLIVSKEQKSLYLKEVSLKKINWISGKKPKLPLKVMASVRYRHPVARATLCRKGKKYKLNFKVGQRAVTSGQSVVFYKRDEVLGGGIIC